MAGPEVLKITGVGRSRGAPPVRRARLVRPAVLAAIALAAAGAAGCAAPVVFVTAGISAAQAGHAAYNSGQLLSARQATLEQAWLATLAALEELAFDVHFTRPPDDPESEGRSAYVMAKDPGGPRVQVKLERASDAVTRVRIRIDFFGDHSLSRLVLSRIDARLPVPPPAEQVGGGW